MSRVRPTFPLVTVVGREGLEPPTRTVVRPSSKCPNTTGKTASGSSRGSSTGLWTVRCWTSLCLSAGLTEAPPPRRGAGATSEPLGVDTRRREAAALLGPRSVGAGTANVGAGIPREAENVSQLCLKEDLDSHGQFVSQLNQQDSYGFLVARVCP